MSKPHLIGTQESLHLAKMLIEEHGVSAADHARNHAARLISDDPAGSDSWVRIAKAVDLLLDTHGSGTLH